MLRRQSGGSDPAYVLRKLRSLEELVECQGKRSAAAQRAGVQDRGMLRGSFETLSRGSQQRFLRAVLCELLAEGGDTDDAKVTLQELPSGALGWTPEIAKYVFYDLVRVGDAELLKAWFANQCDPLDRADCVEFISDLALRERVFPPTESPTSTPERESDSEESDYEESDTENV